jgi:hypothetical protein
MTNPRGSIPCFPIKIMSERHKITFRESELMAAIAGESSGRLTKEMACFLLQTTPQAIGKLGLSLSAKNLIHRDASGTIRLNK